MKLARQTLLAGSAEQTTKQEVQSSFSFFANSAVLGALAVYSCPDNENEKWKMIFKVVEARQSSD